MRYFTDTGSDNLDRIWAPAIQIHRITHFSSDKN